MRSYARIKEVSVGSAKELRQTSMTMALKNMGKVKNKNIDKRKKERVVTIDNKIDTCLTHQRIFWSR